MRRLTKNIMLFFVATLCIILYCEYFIYYIVAAQCSWPILKDYSNSSQMLKAFILSDIHMLGPRRGHWLDKMRREWQMHQAFKAIVEIHEPEVIFILGDVFDEGEWTNYIEFNDYVDRFYKYFSVPDNIKMYVVAGNHDIGFHNHIRRGSVERFYKSLNTSSVQLITMKNSHFVLLNSMAMEGDMCRLCTEARNSIEDISATLKCYKDPTMCKTKLGKEAYSHPIIMQHFPLYRKSDSVCNEPDSPPFPERDKPFRLKIDALSKEATDFLVDKIEPRAVFGGHTHHGCLIRHENGLRGMKYYEYSVPSFSWRNRPDPKYMLVLITSDQYAVHKCGLPRETTIIGTAVVMLSVVIWWTIKKKRIGR